MMLLREFIPLEPVDLPDEFDVEIHGEEPIVNIKEIDDRIVINYTFPGFYRFRDTRSIDGKEISFDQLNISKTGFLAESGKPLLPSFGRYVQIPHNCDFDISVEKGEPIEFEDILVLPAQEKVLDGEEGNHGFEYEEDFYEKDQLYPLDIDEVKGPFLIDGYNALLIHVRPLQYNAANKKLLGYSNVTVTIKISFKDTEVEGFFVDPETNREGFGNHFLNPRRTIEARLTTPPRRIVTPFRPKGPEFLIIFYKDFEGAANKLAHWKRMKGIRTEIISIDSIENDVDKIKKYIRTRRKALFSRLRYVLLFGDVDHIVPEKINISAYGENVTDYYYSTREDPSDSNDYKLPWLAIGRIPVRNKKEAIDVVDQIIKYERSPPCDPEYYKRMTFAAYFQDDNGDDRADRAYMKTMEDIREHLITLGFDIERVYVTNNPNLQEYIDGTQIPVEVVNSIVTSNMATDLLISSTSEGQLMIGHRNHGNTDGWSHPSFKDNNIDAITSEYPSIFYSINCLTGKFDLAAPLESFAEKLLITKVGAPSLIAATRLSNTWLNNDLMRALFDTMWPGVLPTFPGTTASYAVKHNRLGDILCYGKSYLPVSMSGNSSYIKDHFEIYHVHGDPTLEIWRDFPITINLSVRVRRTDLIIKMSSCPKDSVITIWHRNNLLKRIEPSINQLKISLRNFPSLPLPPLRQKILVCFWAPGCRFQMVRVKI